MTTAIHIETDKERRTRQAQHEAFWNRPEAEIWRELTPPEEDLPPDHRGGPYRWFRSPERHRLGENPQDGSAPLNGAGLAVLSYGFLRRNRQTMEKFDARLLS